jgi:NADPH:quinone reductase-like Zn-dependent oxidoreductase
VELAELPDPEPSAGRALVRVHGAGVGLWDVGFLGGGFPGIALPFVPGQEVAGVVEAVGEGVGVLPGERVYGVLFPAGGGFAELALASADQLAPMPANASFQEAAGLVISAGTAYEGLVDRGRLRAGETVLITAAAGGVGSAAVQIAAGNGARVLGVASAANHDYLRGLGASEVFDYHTADWIQQVRATVEPSLLVRMDDISRPGTHLCAEWRGRTAKTTRAAAGQSIRCFIKSRCV